MDRAKLCRVIDANVNRVTEGLRVLEDVARFVIQDENVTKELKGIRHELCGLQKKTECIIFRDPERDLLKEYDGKLESGRKEFVDLVTANSKRVEEGLRVLEEVSKLTFPEYSGRFKEYRFKIYSLEKVMYERLSSICNSG